MLEISVFLGSSRAAAWPPKIANDSVCVGGSHIAYDIYMLWVDYLDLNHSFESVHDFQVS